MEKKIVGVVGSGMVGRDPFDPRCWSRSGYNLFTRLRGAGRLRRAFGVEVPHPLRGLVMARNFRPDRRLWAQRFNLDPLYYRLLTGRIESGTVTMEPRPRCSSPPGTWCSSPPRPQVRPARC